MVFNQNLVAVIKNRGRILRETGNNNDVVYIPYGSEYSILLKNLNTVKALVDVEVDGREAISDLIVRPNSSVELERFFEGDMNKGHKFKFIEKTDRIRDHRGDKVEDGIIRITYQFELPNYWYTYTISGNNWPNDFPQKRAWNDWGSTDGGTTLGINHNQTTYTSNNNLGDQIRSFNCSNQVNEDGITVEGDYSDQSFVHGNIGPIDPELHCINIELKGHKPNKGPVTKPITVKTKLKCDYCGKMNRSRSKFCSECGAALI